MSQFIGSVHLKGTSLRTKLERLGSISNPQDAGAFLRMRLGR